MASSLLPSRRLCTVIILVTALLVLPLTAATTEAQLFPQPGQSFCEYAHETANDPRPLEEVCGESPTPPQPLDCNQLQTCPIPDCDPTRANCPQRVTIECADGSYSTSLGICVPNLECPAGQRLSFPSLTCEAIFKSRTSECIAAFVLCAQWIKCEEFQCGSTNTPEGGLLPYFSICPEPIDKWFREACGLPGR